ncbi:MAG: 1-acyl-sn-glycerol-3-phosphate acyltransferase [Deltaproteobacteria bacterium]|nr:1-acyl-sn-glycerol-3-phosphate acyltransferase [Deltaproteobacteria bacterium]
MAQGGIFGKLRMYGLHLFILVQTVIWSVISILWFLVDSTGSLTHRYGARPWSRVLLWASRVKVEAHGLENLRRGGKEPMVLVCNHQSLFDILALLASLPLDFKFVVKKELGKVPLWGYAMKKAGYIFVDRGQSGQAGALMRTAVERIKAGSAVLFFAEGTRSADGSLGEFKRGAFVLASQARADVAPVAIEGSSQVLPKKSWGIRPGKIKVTVLPLIKDPALKKNSRKLMQATHDALSAALNGPMPAALEQA